MRLAALAIVLALAPENQANARVAQAPANDPGARARILVKQARTAATAGDFSTALASFEQAMALKPSPKLHYNIAICHHRLMLDAENAGKADAAGRHRRAAVDAYNAYLTANPQASDRTDVEQLVAGLGGTPATRGSQPKDEWIEEIARDEPADAPSSFQDEWERYEQQQTEAEQGQPPQAEPVMEPVAEPAAVVHPPQPRKPRDPNRLRGRVGVGFALDVFAPGQLANNPDVEGLPMYGAVIRGGGYIGPKRRFNLGGEIMLTLASTAQRRKLGLSTLQAGVTADYAFVLGTARRFELGVGGVVGVGGQALRRRDGPPLDCAASTGADASGRLFAMFGGRLITAVLLGRRRRHAVVLRITPAVAALAKGTKSDSEDCADVQGPFAATAIDAAASLVVLTDLGYAARF